MLPKALKTCPKSNKSPNLVTLKVANPFGHQYCKPHTVAIELLRLVKTTVILLRLMQCIEEKTNFQWHSIFCKQMPSQTLDGSTYPSYEFGGKFKNSYKKVNFLTFSNLNFRVIFKKIDCFKMKPALLNLYN